MEKSNLEWAEIVKKFPEANFLQSPAYAEMNRLIGEKVIIEDFDGKGRALMVVREAKRGKYLEIPCGPLIDWKDTRLVKRVLKRINEIAKAEKCVFVRIRPQLYKTPENMKILERAGLKKSPMHLAAEHTVVIDLSKSEDELLAKMRRQTRYDVRRAEKLGIEVLKSNSEELFKEFHGVQAETAKRQKFIPPSLETLLAERAAFGDNIAIYVATIDWTGPAVASSPARAGAGDPQATSPVHEPLSKPIAYGLVIKDGKEGDYYEAASTDLNRKLPGAHAILWRAMRDLKAEGYERFNLWGIAPAGQPHHRYAGVTTFKTGFGGEIVEYVPAHDMIISQVRYLKNWIVETARRKRRHL
ncbi:peptidoglycan bridge formation glycyltransferase FemA/FemB family protein [Candidatus Saccharibacteria bacterium]|nr:peptidoglycan bridge formation glycyltransferase FemA/FemB family protein [Candidatus Saccharibacteria bacterium]